MSGHPTKLERAREWVDRAVAAGLDPQLHHYPPGHPRAGRWYYQHEGGPEHLDPGPRPEDILPEIREVLYQTGRVWDYRDGDFHKRKPAS